MSTMAKRVTAGTAAAAVGLLAALVVTAAPAQAVCQGRSQGTGIADYVNGVIVAEERQVVGTCDGDEIYNGQVRDTYTDGYAAKVWYQDGSFEGIVVYADSRTWVGYQFWDQTGNSYASMSLYARPSDRPANEIANFGF